MSQRAEGSDVYSENYLYWYRTPNFPKTHGIPFCFETWKVDYESVIVMHCITSLQRERERNSVCSSTVITRVHRIGVVRIVSFVTSTHSYHFVPTLRSRVIARILEPRAVFALLRLASLLHRIRASSQSTLEQKLQILLGELC